MFVVKDFLFIFFIFFIYIYFFFTWTTNDLNQSTLTNNDYLAFTSLGTAALMKLFAKSLRQLFHLRNWSGVIMKKRVLRNIIISFGIGDEVSRYIKLPDIDFDGTKWNPFVRKKLLAIVICTRD
jgi:hypothetical protein